MPQRPHAVAILALPSVVPFDLGVPVQVFGYPGPDLGRRRYTVTVCGARPGRVPTARGFSIIVPAGLAALTRAATIVIPGLDDLTRPTPAPVLRALRQAHSRGARLITICTGAFVLAEAGLLDGRRATTHWIDVPELARRFPRIAVDPNVLYVDEGTILTSAGIAAGIDLCLHVVRVDHGAAVANAVARRLVIPSHRAGGQAQFIPQAPTEARAAELDNTRRWVLTRLDRRVTVGEMARHGGMSLRTFARRFREETGTTPLRWLLRQRTLRAQALLEETDLPIERVATRCGFSSALSLRVHFRREVRTSPSGYRRAFGRQPAG